MFILDGKPIPLDTPFEANGTSYPANWLRLATPEERAAIGITEEPDPLIYDQRFYWGYTASGTLIPKDHTELVSLWSDNTRQTANSLLNPTDWIIIREADNGVAAEPAIKSWREAVRLACGSKVYEIEQTATTDQLADYITYVTPSGGSPSDYSSWPVYTPSGVYA
jgi:hypothetical protein